jgi:hypothetical protein
MMDEHRNASMDRRRRVRARSLAAMGRTPTGRYHDTIIIIFLDDACIRHHRLI